MITLSAFNEGNFYEEALSEHREYMNEILQAQNDIQNQMNKQKYLYDSATRP